MNKGKLIVIEGSCDGIGKSTQYELLYNDLEKDGYKLVKHHFPSYNTTQGRLVEEYLKGEYGHPKDLSPYFVNSLYAIDRAVSFKKELQKDYDEGKVLLFDRYTTSSIIYQSSLIDDIRKKNEFIDYIVDFEYNKLGIPTPDEVIFLTAPFSLVTELRKSRKENEGVSNDIHERDLSFMKKVYDNSEYLSDYLNWNKVECSSNNKMRTIEDIHEEVYQKVKRKI